MYIRLSWHSYDTFLKDSFFFFSLNRISTIIHSRAQTAHYTSHEEMQSVKIHRKTTDKSIGINSSNTRATVGHEAKGEKGIRKSFYPRWKHHLEGQLNQKKPDSDVNITSDYCSRGFCRSLQLHHRSPMQVPHPSLGAQSVTYHDIQGCCCSGP